MYAPLGVYIMAFTTGTVASFFDLLTELKNFISTNQHSDTLGTGDGVQTTFSKTLPNTPIADGQLGMFFTIGGVKYLVWEQNGVFSHELITTSSINKLTGDISSTFAQPIDNTIVIELIYSTGAAGQDWIIMLEQNAQDSSLQDAYPTGSNQEIIFKNSGISGLDAPAFGIREHSRLATNLFGWNLNSYREINTALLDTSNWNFNKNDTGFTSYNATDELWSTMASQAFADDTIVYWFFANKRRVIVVARSQGNVYTGSYMGAGIRFASPSNYPIPNIVMGSAQGNINITSQISFHEFFTHQTRNAGVPGRYFGVGTDGNYFDAGEVDVLPTRQFTNSGILKKTSNNKIVLQPVYLNEANISPERVGMQLDGVYLCPFVNQQSEDIHEIGADDYIVFQNVFRNDYDDFTAIKAE